MKKSKLYDCRKTITVYSENEMIIGVSTEENLATNNGTY